MYLDHKNVIARRSRGESICIFLRKIEVCRLTEQAAADAHRASAFGSVRFPSEQKKRHPKGCLFFGGAEGNRTPVRKQLDKNFSGRRPLFTFPHPDGNGHPAGISSFIMHGTRKALRTHGLHLNHTLARTVDLPGRMGA